MAKEEITKDNIRDYELKEVEVVLQETGESLRGFITNLRKSRTITLLIQDSPIGWLVNTKSSVYRESHNEDVREYIERHQSQKMLFSNSDFVKERLLRGWNIGISSYTNDNIYYVGGTGWFVSSKPVKIYSVAPKEKIINRKYRWQRKK